MTVASRVQVRGTVSGSCNICGNYGKLTEDHVPPKGTQRVRAVDLYRITDVLGVERPIGKRRGRHMQSGALYRTLCASCNSGLLGAKYDPELVQYANAVTTILKTPFLLPTVARITIRPGTLARSILGHLLAVGIKRTESTPLLDAVRTFVQDDRLPLPPGIEIHPWVYPYPRQIAIRDAALLLDGFNTTIVFWCLKFFPVGFFVTWKNAHPERVSLPRLSQYMLHAGSHRVDLPLPLHQLPHQFWPEAPPGDGAVLYGEGAYAAEPRDARFAI